MVLTYIKDPLDTAVGDVGGHQGGRARLGRRRQDLEPVKSYCPELKPADLAA